MAYCVSNIIGIRLGGVFSGEPDMQDIKSMVTKVIISMKDGDFPPNIDDAGYCLSNELSGSKGSYAVIAGVFNYWGYESVSRFAAMLSEEFNTNVMVMSWDEQIDEVKCDVFFGGKPISEIAGSLFDSIRRVC